MTDVQHIPAMERPPTPIPPMNLPTYSVIISGVMPMMMAATVKMNAYKMMVGRLPNLSVQYPVNGM
jgi:hypothetical protein